ncbi:hypothetical protein EU545_02950 [Candidatus Thorarchaeota archaeon]|nr:MAG: hypothetical protein EU545_02950 [Candidatus Thorarchaeota archaeon]
MDDAENRCVSLKAIYSRMDQALSNRPKEERREITSKAIEAILNGWKALKVVDYDNQSKLAWHLKALTDKEIQEYRELPETAKALLKMLYQSHDGFQPGAMKHDDVLKNLRKHGFDVDDIPYALGIVEEAIAGDDEWWVYLKPMYEFSDEFKALQKESEEKAWKKQEWLMRQDE